MQRVCQNSAIYSFFITARKLAPLSILENESFYQGEMDVFVGTYDGISPSGST